MINFSILISSSEVVTGPGGLFDINATLPLVAIQFLLLMVVLNVILYNPLMTFMEEREEYILTKLSKASEMVEYANYLTTECEQELDNIRKAAKLEITNSQKYYKEFFEIEVLLSQIFIDTLLHTITKDLRSRKETALESDSLDNIVQSLCDNIATRFAI